MKLFIWAQVSTQQEDSGIIVLLPFQNIIYFLTMYLNCFTYISQKLIYFGIEVELNCFTYISQKLIYFGMEVELVIFDTISLVNYY